MAAMVACVAILLCLYEKKTMYVFFFTNNHATAFGYNFNALYERDMKSYSMYIGWYMHGFYLYVI